jgi:hypothetical protein
MGTVDFITSIEPFPNLDDSELIAESTKSKFAPPFRVEGVGTQINANSVELSKVSYESEKLRFPLARFSFRTA